MLLRTENVLNVQDGLRYGSVSAAFLWSLPLGVGTAAISDARAALVHPQDTRETLHVQSYVQNTSKVKELRPGDGNLLAGSRAPRSRPSSGLSLHRGAGFQSREGILLCLVYGLGLGVRMLECFRPPHFGRCLMSPLGLGARCAMPARFGAGRIWIGDELLLLFTWKH